MEHRGMGDSLDESSRGHSVQLPAQGRVSCEDKLGY